MPTQKQRINLTVPKELNKMLIALAKRDHTTVASKTMDLVRIALEIEEDIQLGKIAEQRTRKKEKLISHERAWL